jgi:hypothetical protein
MYGLIVINLPIACDVVAATCAKIARRKQTTCPHRHAATASWWMERTPSVQLLRLQPHERRDPKKEGAKNTRGRVFSSKYTTPGLSFVAAAAAAVEKPSVPASVWQQEPGQSVPAFNVNS